MSQPSFDWQLTVLGPARLAHVDGRSVRADRRSFALLALLALEGEQARAKVAELLWPEAATATARNNLVHLLRRLRAASEADLVLAGGQTLRLAPGVWVDAAHLDAVQPPAALLSDLDFDDAPDLADWVLAQREAVQVRWGDAQRAEIARAEAAGSLREALAAAEALLASDPLSEDTHRAVMRLHYALGDRPASLRAYHRLKDLLESELGVEPSAETFQLARDIDRGQLSGPTDAPSIPLSVLRPPTLVGRADEWAKMEAAWAGGLGIMVIGDPGSGKTRLAGDFLRSKTSHQLLFFEGRPGDQAAPYTTHARTYRQVLDACPDLDLPDWVRRELARIIPELGEAPPPMSSEADKLRFYEAKVEMIRLVAARGPVIMASDDLQFMDEASVEAGGYVFSRFFGQPGTNLRTLFCFRTASLGGLAARVAQQMIDAGLSVPIRLGPLSEGAVGDLLGEVLPSEMQGPDAPALAGDLRRFTDGNPQFVLEAVKSMFETRTFGLDAAQASIAGDVAQMIGGRLARLSDGALHAARAAAVLRGQFTLELVAEVLHIGLLEIASAWEELEGAQITQSERFIHDLVLETVLSGMPATVRRLLHRSAARALEGAGAAPGRVARHWLDGGDPAQAAPWLMRAGELAESTLRLAEAADFYREAARAFEGVGQDAQATQASEAAQRTSLVQAS